MTIEPASGPPSRIITTKNGIRVGDTVNPPHLTCAFQDSPHPGVSSLPACRDLPVLDGGVSQASKERSMCGRHHRVGCQILS